MNHSKKNRPVWLPALVLVVVLGGYVTSYLVVRKRHTLLMTGWYHNLYDGYDRPSPDASWKDVQIRAQHPGSKWLEAAFAPLIWTETKIQVAFGDEPGD